MNVLRPLATTLLFILCGYAVYAHSGFNTLAWREAWDAYTVSVLEDFHVAGTGQGKVQLFVQLSNGGEAAPASTQVDAVIRYEGDTLYEGAVPYLSESSADGETSYAGYLLDIPLRQEGAYGLELTLSGPLGTVRRTYAVHTQQGGPSVLEVLPSVLILAIVLGGTALLFVPLKRQNEDARKESREIPSQLSPRD